MRPERSIRHPDGKPTIRQVYAIARLLLADAGEAWPANREEASELIDRLRGPDEERDASKVLAGPAGSRLR